MKTKTTKEIIFTEFEEREDNELLYIKNIKWLPYNDHRLKLDIFIKKIEFYGMVRRSGYIHLNNSQWNHIKNMIRKEE